jgi:hypothetical protein
MADNGNYCNALTHFLEQPSDQRPNVPHPWRFAD